jgi:hypothetical protein
LRKNMKVDTRFPTKLNAIDDAPELFRGVLADNFPAKEPVRLLVHAPTFATAGARSPATVLAVTNVGWFLATEKEEGAVSIQKCGFSDTLFLELTSILLWGQLKIHFAAAGTSYSALVRFDTVGEKFYRDAIDLILSSIQPTLGETIDSDDNSVLISESWPLHFRTEAQRYRPKNQRLLAATQWPSVMGGFQRELFPAGALLVTERELVLISEEKISPRQHPGDLHRFGGIVTYLPIAQLSDFHLSQHERFDVLALQVHSMHGAEKLEIVFPADHEKALSRVMKQVFAQSSAP